MINVKFELSGNFIHCFEIKGHSNLSDYGNDIVCAALSSTCIMTINGIIENLKVDIEYKIEDGYCYFKYEKNNDDVNLLLKSFYSFVKELEKQYPKNIKLKVMEV